MKLHVDIQTACVEPIPEEEDICSWIAAAMPPEREQAEVSVRLVSEEEMTELNQTWRGKSGSTNVLSFPSDLPEDIDSPLLGDIVICAAVVAREAAQQNKTETAHWSHMFVHGSLHLLGYDHVEDQEATIMEAMETDILNRLGFTCPYGSQAQ